ncbi:hypothetical protein BD770DRAFT_417135, partial [Pilaira anomala]
MASIEQVGDSQLYKLIKGKSKPRLTANEREEREREKRERSRIRKAKQRENPAFRSEENQRKRRRYQGNGNCEQSSSQAIEPEESVHHETMNHHASALIQSKYRKLIKEGPTSICICCNGTWFPSQTKILKAHMIVSKGGSLDFIKTVFGSAAESIEVCNINNLEDTDNANEDDGVQEEDIPVGGSETLLSGEEVPDYDNGTGIRMAP